MSSLRILKWLSYLLAGIRWLFYLLTCIVLGWAQWHHNTPWVTGGGLVVFGLSALFVHIVVRRCHVNEQSTPKSSAS